MYNLYLERPARPAEPKPAAYAIFVDSGTGFNKKQILHLD